MSDAVQALQAAAVAALSAHPVLAAQLTGIYDGPPPRADFPYVAVTDGLVSDWGTKTQQGREIRLAFTVWDDGEAASRLTDLMGHVDDALLAIPRDLPGWRIASLVFLRSIVLRDPAGPWAGLVEHRVRLLAV
ncbi:DUF3168 domain-containing protein [Sphingorhabdus sp.]|jgi:hypothetical protein|uniref:DUF3168 domain-containing protein n=1 Tax=Sphingorhabdus sp. TaxID=1902408 RepID=UPI0037C84B52